MKVLSIVGARPQFVKLAPVAQAFQRAGHEHVIVHTGQHYDRSMSEVFFTDLGIAPPDINLKIGSALHGAQTGAMLEAIEKVLGQAVPDWVIVYGDTNSTLAGAVAAVKLQIPVAHLEAGLRSFNRRMPEEHNRVLVDHAADLLLVPTEGALHNLDREGIAERAVHVGDVMTDVLLNVRARLGKNHFPKELAYLEAELRQGFHLATVHRAENTDDPNRLESVISCLSTLPNAVLLVAHPRLVARCKAAGIVLDRGSLRVVPPLPYPTMVSMVLRSDGVITDSGGLQKEAFLLRVPCFTLRTETEWVETVESSWNTLVPNPKDLLDALRHSPRPTDATPYGCGDAARRVERELAIRTR